MSKFCSAIIFFVFSIFMLGFLFTNTTSAYLPCDDGTTSCYPDDCQDYADWGKVNNSICLEKIGPPLTANFCDTSQWVFKYQACRAKMSPRAQKCIYEYYWVSLQCKTTDSCTSSWPYLNPGICDASRYDGRNPESACVVGPSVYKTCCSSDGTTDGACRNGTYDGECPSNSSTVICGVDQATCDEIRKEGRLCSTAPCGDSTCKDIFPPTPLCTPSTNSFTQCCGNNLAQNVNVTSYSGGYNCPSQEVTTGECNIQDTTRCGKNDNKYWFCNPNTGSCQETTSTYSDKSACQSSIQQYWGISTSCFLKSSDTRLDEHSQCQKSCICKAGEYRCSTTTNACMVN